MATKAGEQQKRLQTAVRAQLLATGAFDVGQLCALRDDSDLQTTTNMIRLAGNAVLAVAVDGGVVYPAFQFTDRGAPREGVSSLIQVLQDAGLGPWQTWTWLVEPTGMLSGEVPIEMVFIEAERAMRAAARLAERSGPARL